MKEERSIILKMLAEGKISLDEANELLEALDEVSQEDLGGQESRQRTEDRETQRGNHREHQSHHHRQPHGRTCWPFDFNFDFQDFGKDIKGMMKDVMQGVREGFGHGVNFSDWFDTAFGTAKYVDSQSIVQSAEGIEKMRIKNGWGDVTVRKADTEEIFVDAEIVAWGSDESSAEYNAKDIRISAVITGAEMEIRADTGSETPHRRYKINYQIKIPAGVHPDVTTKSGNIEIHDIAGNITLSTFSGNVEASALEGSVCLRSKSGNIRFVGGKGDCDVSALSGDIVVRNVNGNGRFSTKSGDVTIEQAEGHTVSNTLSGDVEIARTSGDVSAESKSGDIDITDVAGDVSVRTLSGDVKLRDISSKSVSAHVLSGDISAEIQVLDNGEVSLRATDGDVRLRIQETAKVQVHAKTLSGKITCDLPLTSVERDKSHITGILQTPDGQIDLSTASGDVVIEKLPQ